MALRLQGISGESEQLVKRLRQLQDGSGHDIWRGQAADAFRETVAEIGPGAVQMVDAYREASDALLQFSEALRDAQAKAARAEADGRRALDERADAATRHGEARVEHDRSSAVYQQCKTSLAEVNRLEDQARAAGDTVWYAKLLEYERQTLARQQWAHQRASAAWTHMQAADSARNQADARLQAAKLLGSQTAELRDVAARRAVIRIDAVSDSRINYRNSITKFLTDTDATLRDWFTSPTFEKFVEVLDYAAGVLALVGLIAACFIPGGQIVAVLGFAALFTGALATVGTFFQVTYGKKSPADLVKSGLSVIPGLKVAKHGGKAVRRWLRSGHDQKLLIWGETSLHKIDRQIRATPPILRPVRYFQLGNQVAGVIEKLVEPIQTSIKITKDIRHLWADFVRPPEPNWVAFPAAGSGGTN